MVTTAMNSNGRLIKMEPRDSNNEVRRVNIWRNESEDITKMFTSPQIFLEWWGCLINGKGFLSFLRPAFFATPQKDG